MNKRNTYENAIKAESKRLNRRFDLTPRGACFYEYLKTIAIQENYEYIESYENEFDRLVAIAKEQLKDIGHKISEKDVRQMTAEIYCDIWSDCYERFKSR